jgi:hypothetical protein
MKAILEFDLPDEKFEFNYAIKGVNYSLVIDDLENWIRSKVKYTDQTTFTLEELREKLNEYKRNNGVLE